MSDILEADNFAYNAPQFCNLSTANTEDDPRVQEYFNYNHENLPQYEDISSDDDTKQSYYTPLKLDSIAGHNSSNLRKSMSMGNLLPSTNTLPLLKHISKDRLNILAQPKPRMMQANFESNAELLTKFHQKTPKRFRTASAHNQGIGTTIPHSPKLATRSRSRQTLYMPQDVREEQALEELKKLKVKATPIPKTNYAPVVPIKIDKKPSTVIQPFNLTRIAPKKPFVLHETAPVGFRAKPAPKSIFQKDNHETKPKPLKANHTTPAPFSFQSRHEEMLKKHEQLLTKVIEEEKKRREFHAQPIPKNICKFPIRNGPRSVNSKENIDLINIASGKSSNPNLANETLFNNAPNFGDAIFKAKPASVLKREPFVPKLNMVPPTVISAFNLHTERRVADREDFEAKKRMREEAWAEYECAKQQVEVLKEKTEIASLRKQMMIKANPIRRFKPVLPVTPREITIPDTPKFNRQIKRSNSAK